MIAKDLTWPNSKDIYKKSSQRMLLKMAFQVIFTWKFFYNCQVFVGHLTLHFAIQNKGAFQASGQ
jgi:hypothetical protein